MPRETINSKQLILLFALFLSCSYLGVAGSEAKQDMWLSLCIAILFFLPLLLMCARIATLHPDKHLFAILFDTFGKVIGWIVSSLYVLFFFGLAAVTLFVYSEATHILSLTRTPLLFLMAALGGFTAWSLHSGLRILGRVSSLLFFIVAVLNLGAFLLSIPNMSIESIQPVGQQPPQNILKNALYFFISPFAQSIVLLSLLGHMPTNHSKYKVVFWGGGLGALILLSTLVRDLLVLGTPTYTKSYFPSYNALSIIHVGGFIQRIDIIFSFALFLGAFMKICLSLNATCQGCVKLTGIKNPLFVLVPLTLLLCAAGYGITKVSIHFFTGIQNFLFCLLSLQVLVPFLVWILSEVKNRKETRIST